MTAHEAKMDLRLARCCDLRIRQKEITERLGVSLRTLVRYEQNGPLRPISRLVRLMVSTPVATDSAPEACPF